jgi:uncharacterized protein (DUF305 family)
MQKSLIAAGAALVLAGGAVLAQGHSGHGTSGHSGHSGHGAAPAAAAASPSTAGYQAANARMHKDMDIAFSGDPDVDFARGMIPHHQGAIDMAKVVLQHGKDPEMKKLAQEIIAAQEKEIAHFRDWLKKKGR